MLRLQEEGCQNIKVCNTPRIPEATSADHVPTTRAHDEPGGNLHWCNGDTGNGIGGGSVGGVVELKTLSYRALLWIRHFGFLVI